MKANYDTSTLKRSVNRSQMRAFNHKNHGRFNREQIEQIMMMYRLKTGQIDEQDIRTMAKNRVAHLDNDEKFPNGTEVKMNVKEITSRPKTDFADDYWKFVNENADTVFHLDREENDANLVCLAEDERYNAEGERIPRWFFDMYTDLLVKNADGEFVDPFSIDDEVLEDKETI